MRFPAASTPLLPLLCLLLLPGCLSRQQWVLQHVPVVLPQQTASRPAPHFLAQARLDVSSPCDPDCHRKAPKPSYWDLRHILSYETLHSNGSLTATSVGIYGYNPNLDTSVIYKARSRVKREARVRRKRQIFGHDGRFSIAGHDFLLKFPFSVAVKLSTGCSGTLVGDRHVLTAAHCVHDGKNYVKGAQRLRVGFLKPKYRDLQSPNLFLNLTNHVENDPPLYAPPTNDKMKFQWIRARRTHVPKGWIKANANDIGMDYDYALLELKKPHKRSHMKLGVSPLPRDYRDEGCTFPGSIMTVQGTWCTVFAGPERRRPTFCTSTVMRNPGRAAQGCTLECGTRGTADGSVRSLECSRDISGWRNKGRPRTLTWRFDSRL
uniref:Serine protease 23 n=1 Tax=Neogobius melanostomus TaxID=47308 RepID=A0A8C6TBB3_9GOBI